MAKKIPDLWPLVAVGGVLWFMSRRGGLTAIPSPNGIGDNGVMNGTGPAIIGGNIVSANVDPDVALSAHRTPKTAGERADVTVQWENTTTDFNGNPIGWPALLDIEFGHSTGWGGAGGWDEMGKLLNDATAGGKQILHNPVYAPAGANTDTASIRIGREPNPPQDWDVRVRLFMEESNALGNPVAGAWTEIASETHDRAIVTVPETGFASYGGMLGTINVSNRGTMQKLGMRAQRPPWGIAVGEDRSWPTSNRNVTLPGVKIRVRQAQGGRRHGSSIGPGWRTYAV